MLCMRLQCKKAEKRHDGEKAVHHGVGHVHEVGDRHRKKTRERTELENFASARTIGREASPGRRNIDHARNVTTAM